MPATATRPRAAQRLIEKVIAYSTPRVDRERGVLRGVKILGTTSLNGRRYTAECIRSASPLYENCVVRIGHPKRAGDPREVADTFGKLTNVRVAADGLYGDLYFLKTHPMADRICEGAEKTPPMFGLSHDATGDCAEDRDGTIVVNRIVQLRSCDVVDTPATVKGFFESHLKGVRSMRNRTTREAEADLDTDTPPPAESFDDDEPANEPEADAAKPWRKPIADAIAALLALADDESHEMAGKLMKMIEPGKTAAVAESRRPLAESRYAASMNRILGIQPKAADAYHKTIDRVFPGRRESAHEAAIRVKRALDAGMRR